MEKSSAQSAPQAEYELTFVDGVEGKCVYLHQFRICGPKPWGGGQVIATFKVTAEDILRAIPELREASK